MLDRDRDEFSQTMRSSPHVIYTYSTDVESDILLNSDIWAAARAAYGIDSSLSTRVQAAIGDPPVFLFSLWRDWLKLGLIAIASGETQGLPWSQPSPVNVDTFREVDQAEVSKRFSELQQRIGQQRFSTLEQDAETHLQQRNVRLLKGRWLARFIDHSVKTYLNDETLRANVSPHVIVDTGLATVSHSGAWVKDYTLAFERLFRSPG